MEKKDISNHLSIFPIFSGDAAPFLARKNNLRLISKEILRISRLNEIFGVRVRIKKSVNDFGTLLWKWTHFL